MVEDGHLFVIVAKLNHFANNEVGSWTVRKLEEITVNLQMHLRDQNIIMVIFNLLLDFLTFVGRLQTILQDIHHFKLSHSEIVFDKSLIQVNIPVRQSIFGLIRFFSIFGFITPIRHKTGILFLILRCNILAFNQLEYIFLIQLFVSGHGEFSSGWLKILHLLITGDEILFWITEVRVQTGLRGIARPDVIRFGSKVGILFE